MDVEIREMREDDTRDVLDLYARTFGGQARELWERRHRWEFFENPAARIRPAKRYVARVRGELAAFIAGLPVRMKVATDVHGVLMPCDMMASREARGYNLAWRMTRRLVAEGGPLACSLAQSDAARKLYDALAWRSIDVAPAAMRPRDLGAISARYLRSPGGLRHVLRAARALGAAIDRVTWPRAPRDVSIVEAAGASPDLDDLWRAVSRAFPVVGVRDRVFVAWRFLEDPSGPHALIEARRRDVLQGFAAVAIARKRGLRFGKIMDLFCDPGDGDVARALLRGALATLARRGADVCVVKGLHPEIRRTIAPYFPLRAPAARARVWWGGDPAVAPLVYDASSWHATHADGDEDMTP